MTETITTPAPADVDIVAVPASDPLLAIRGLRKQFTRANGQTVTAVDDITLSIAPGEFIVLLGPSGCGKTTLLRCIGGLESASAGTIEVGGRVKFDAKMRIDVPTRRRGISMVFQSYALWPNMTVFENIVFPLKSRRKGMSKAEMAAAVEEIARVVGIEDLLTQYPHHISGGQQQRVALARALVNGNALVLFDEPLSNVDAKVRKDLRIELASLQGKYGFAAVYVTHDQEDAMELADRIVVLDGGRIAQVGAPQDIYENPANSYVAGFVGSSNSVEGTVRSVTAASVRGPRRRPARRRHVPAAVHEAPRGAARRRRQRLAHAPAEDHACRDARGSRAHARAHALPGAGGHGVRPPAGVGRLGRGGAASRLRVRQARREVTRQPGARR